MDHTESLYYNHTNVSHNNGAHNAKSRLTGTFILAQTLSFLLALCTINMFFTMSDSYARWAIKDDAAVEYKLKNVNLSIKADGTYEKVIEMRVKVLNELGRGEIGTIRFQYNHNTSLVSVLEAKTINGSEENVVPLSAIEHKPLASDIKGFDQLYQIMVSFPRVAIGSEIYIKIKEVMLKTPIPNYFATSIRWDDSLTWWKQSHFNVKSLLPLYISVNDPHKRLSVKQSTKGRYHEIDVTSTTEFSEYTVMEDKRLVDDRNLTWVDISSADNYATFGNVMATKYAAILNHDLPPLFQKIASQAALIQNETDRFNKITSMLATNIRYMGDWRSINGMYLPRNFDAIAKSGVGDCKDFAASTTAILRNLGYKADVAIIYRGYPYIPLAPNSLPSLQDFNHAIVKVIDHTKKVRWLDPTNFISMADGMFEDIADRPTMVLACCGASVPYEHTPKVDYKHNKRKQSTEITFDTARSIAHKNCNLTLAGESAQNFTGAMLLTSEDSVKDYLAEKRGYNVKAVLPDLNTRIAKNLSFIYSYDENESLSHTNFGPSVVVPLEGLNLILDIRKDQVGDVLLATPSTYDKSVVLLDYKAKNIDALNYKINTKWFRFSRQYQNTSNGIQIDDRLEFFRDFIKRTEINTTEFEKIKLDISKNMSQVLIIEQNK